MQKEYTYSRNATVQVKNFEPQQVFHCEKVISEEDITQEQRDKIKESVDAMIKKDIQYLYDLKDGKIVDKEEVEEGQTGIDPNHIYIPEKCKELSMKFSGGQFLVSVTSVFSYLYPIDFPKDALEVYGERGTLIHDTWEHNILNKTNLKPSEFSKERAEAIEKKEVKFNFKGNSIIKILKADDCNPGGFIEKYGEDFIFEALEENVDNREHGFYGRLDFRGKYQGKTCIGDVKTSSSYNDENKEKYFKQMAGYSLCYPDIECIVIVPLNPKNKCGYSKPIVCEEVKKYQELFLEDLAKFKKAIGM